MHTLLIRLLAAGSLAVLAAVPATAQTVRLTDSNATTIRGGEYEDRNFSSARVLEVRASANPSYERRIILKFDTHNRFPKNTRIASARLVLTVAGGNPEARRLTAYRGSLAYDEDAATWNRRKSGVAWPRSGGDAQEVADEQTVTNAVGSQVTFDVTNTVQRVIAGTYSSASRYTRFLIDDGGGNSRSSYKQFYSDHAADATVRPVLVITLAGAGGRAEHPDGGSTPSQPDRGSAGNDDGKAPGGGDDEESGEDEDPESDVDRDERSTITMLDWNIHHGYNVHNKHSLQAQIAYIARVRPDVVSLNEVERYTGWGNEDQPARIAALLKAGTGRTYHYQFAQRAGNSRGQGNLLLSIYPFESTADHLLSYDRSVAHATIIVKGRRIALFSTHLDAESSGRRNTQVGELTRWAASFAGARVLMGDFNAWPGAGEIIRIAGDYHDVWVEAKKMGRATANSGNPAGNTRRSRIDYVRLSKGSTTLKIRAARVLDRKDLSDHRPIVATFEIR